MTPFSFYIDQLETLFRERERILKFADDNLEKLTYTGLKGADFHLRLDNMPNQNLPSGFNDDFLSFVPIIGKGVDPRILRDPRDIAPPEDNDDIEIIEIIKRKTFNVEWGSPPFKRTKVY